MIVIVFWQNTRKASATMQWSGYISISVSDLLIAVYLSIIGISDLIYRDIYVTKQKMWTSSTICKLAASMSMTELFVSTWIHFIMSIEKWYRFYQPFKHVSINVQVTSLLLTWMVFGGFSLAIHFIPGCSPTSICFGFVMEGHPNTEVERLVYFFKWLAGIFVSVSLATIPSTFALNVCTVMLIQQSAKRSSQNVTSQRRLILVRSIVMSFSNLLQWITILPVFFLSLTGDNFNILVINWIAILVLPMTALLNPCIYTFSIKKFSNYVSEIISM